MTIPPHINDLIIDFTNDPRTMRAAKYLVCSTFEIPQQDFEGLLYGAFMKAWQSWDYERAAFKTHVITCLKSECLDALRKQTATPSSIEYADKVATGVNPERRLYMKNMLEIILERIMAHDEHAMLFSVLVCGENYAIVCDNPAQARKIVERFRTTLKSEFGDIFN